MKRSILWILFFSLAVSIYAQDNEGSKIKAFTSSIDEESSYNYKDVLEPLLKIYGQFKDDYLINLRIGWLYYQKKDFSNSVKYYSIADKLSNSSTEALLGLTLPYSSMNKWDEIETIYEKILDKDSRNYTANLNLGQIYFNSKNYLNSKIYFEKIFEDYPSDYSANLYLGWTYYYLGNSSKANKLFVNALIAQPGDKSAIEGLNLTK